jgi:hypothetical protein
MTRCAKPGCKLRVWKRRLCVVHFQHREQAAAERKAAAERELKRGGTS